MVLDYSKWDRILASENEDSAEERATSPSKRVGMEIDVDTGQVGGEHVAWAEKKVQLAGEKRSCTMSLTFSWCRCSGIAQNARVQASCILTWLSTRQIDTWKGVSMQRLRTCSQSLCTTACCLCFLFLVLVTRKIARARREHWGRRARVRS